MAHFITSVSGSSNCDKFFKMMKRRTVLSEVDLISAMNIVNASLAIHQTRLGGTFQCPHSHIFSAFLSPFLGIA